MCSLSLPTYLSIYPPPFCSNFLVSTLFCIIHTSALLLPLLGSYLILRLVHFLIGPSTYIMYILNMYTGLPTHNDTLMMT